MEIKKPNIVELKWIDAQSLDTPLMNESDLKEFDEGLCAYIVGFLVKETRCSYFIAKEWWETGQFKYIHIIPKKGVIEIKRWEIKKKKSSNQ